MFTRRPIPRRLLVFAPCLIAAGALTSAAAADIVVSSASGEVQVTVVSKAGSDGNHAIVIDRIESFGALKVRVRQQNGGHPPISASTGCSGNVILNEVLCDFETDFRVTMGDAIDNVLVTEPPILEQCVPGPDPSDPFIVDLGAGSDVLAVDSSTQICGAGAFPVRSFSPSVTARGGTGNDTLGGGPFRDQLFGDAGNDVVRGNAGNDVLRGGTGADQIDGGSGFDAVTYAESTSGVVVSVGGGGADGAVVGGVSEGDSVGQTVEEVIGSNLADTLSVAVGAHTLTGLAGNDSLLGGSLDDRLDAGAGNDTVSGGAGVDVLLGGDGDDALSASGDAIADSVVCGAGKDSARVDLADFVNTNPRAPDCESVVRLAVDDGEPSRATGKTLKLRSNRTARLTVSCPAAAGVDCAGTLTVSDPRNLDAVLATATYEIAPGTREVVAVRFSAVEARLLRSRGKAAVQTSEQGLSTKGPRSSLRTLQVR